MPVRKQYDTVMEHSVQIDIQARNFSLTDAMRNHAERRLQFALTRSDSHIRCVVLRLSDINGPRGGADKRCHLKVILNGLTDVIVEDIQADLYLAIDRATDRAGRTVARKIDRHQCMIKKNSALEPLIATTDPVSPLDREAPADFVDLRTSNSRKRGS